MTLSDQALELDEATKRALAQAYRLLIQLADEAAGDANPAQEPTPPTAPDDAQEAPSPRGA